jgi:hypothetical protein
MAVEVMMGLAAAPSAVPTRSFVRASEEPLFEEEDDAVSKRPRLKKGELVPSNDGDEEAPAAGLRNRTLTRGLVIFGLVVFAAALLLLLPPAQFSPGSSRRQEPRRQDNSEQVQDNPSDGEQTRSSSSPHGEFTTAPAPAMLTPAPVPPSRPLRAPTPRVRSPPPPLPPMPCPLSPPPTPPALPPPLLPPIPPTAAQVVAALNSRYIHGHPSSDLNAAGVLIHTFDGADGVGARGVGDRRGDRLWLPCPKEMGWCSTIGRFSVSLTKCAPPRGSNPLSSRPPCRAAVPPYRLASRRHTVCLPPPPSGAHVHRPAPHTVHQPASVGAARARGAAHALPSVRGKNE